MKRTTVAPAKLCCPALVARNLGGRGIASIMYPFGRARQGLVWALAVLQILGLGGGSNRVAVASPTDEIVAEVEVLSPEWMERLAGEDLGCGQARVPYKWRPCGFGSNINNLLHAWEYAVVVEGWSDVAVLVDEEQLKELDCSLPSGGLESGGWGCIFSSMPHLCTFNSVEAWQAYMDSAGVSAEDRKEADRLAESLGQIWTGPISESFKKLDVDQRGARAMMITFLWRYITPWVRRDVNKVTHVRETFQTSPFIAIHVRRGDKLQPYHKDMIHGVESYLEEAVRVLDQDVNGTTVDAIKGIWVASDDKNVVDEVREKSGAYFPTVLVEDIVYVAGGVPGGVQIEKVTTHSRSQGYGSLVYLMADIEQLVAADVFVGSCSSNIGRLVMVLRDGLGKDKKTAISVDIPWSPMRQRRLVLD